MLFHVIILHGYVGNPDDRKGSKAKLTIISKTKLTITNRVHNISNIATSFSFHAVSNILFYSRRKYNQTDAFLDKLLFTILALTAINHIIKNGIT